MTTWPPDLAFVKTDMGVADTRDDPKLQQTLDAAVAFVQAKRPEINYTGDASQPGAVPSADLVLGTARLAWRWHMRRRSPDALIQMAEFGSTRVPAFDADVERLLGIGKYRGPVFA